MNGNDPQPMKLSSATLRAEQALPWESREKSRESSINGELASKLKFWPRLFKRWIALSTG